MNPPILVKQIAAFPQSSRKANPRDLKENAETYARGAYSGVLKALEPVVEGTAQVTTYDVSNSTFHKIVAHATA